MLTTGEALRTAEEYEDKTSVEAWVLTRLKNKFAPTPASDTPIGRDDIEATAYVNHGRWIVDCPFCSSAQMAFDDDRRFYCVECYNAAVDHRWIIVVWPAPETRQAIESILGARSDPKTRNWYTHETVEQLRKENRAHGVEVPPAHDEG